MSQLLRQSFFEACQSLMNNPHLAADARGLLLGEGHQGSDLRGDDRLREGVLAPEQRRLGLRLAEDRLEDPQQRLRQHVGQVILGVDGNVVLKDVNGILE